MTRTPILYCDDGGEIELPFKWTICGDCDGHGQSSAYLGAFTGEQMREDPDFAEEYFAGSYDRGCDACGGAGKVKVADRSRMSPEQVAEYDSQIEDEASDREVNRMERLMEGGWREEGWFA